MGQPIRILEVGSFEGFSTTWIMHHLLGHKDARLCSADWFEGSKDHEWPEFDLEGLWPRFCSYVQRAQN